MIRPPRRNLNIGFFEKINSSGESISFDTTKSNSLSPLGHMIHCDYFLTLESNIYTGINTPEVIDRRLNRKDHKVNKKFIKISR